MIKIRTTNTIQSLDDSNTRFEEVIHVIIEIRNVSEREKDGILQYFRNDTSTKFEKKINEGPRSLIIELGLKGPFAVKKKDFSSIVEMATSNSQDKSLKKIKKLFSEKFKNFTSVREKQAVSKIYTMYLKQLKEGNIGKSKREFRQFLKNILEN